MDQSFGEMLDTSREKRAKYYELLKALTPERRAAKAASLSRMVRALARESIRRDHPSADRHEVDVRLAVRLYGSALARRIYGRLPKDAR